MELTTTIEAIEMDQEYCDTQEAQAQAEQAVEHWLKKANYLNIVSLVFALGVNLILLIFMILAVFGYKYRQKLATLIVTYSQF